MNNKLGINKGYTRRGVYRASSIDILRVYKYLNKSKNKKRRRDILEYSGVNSNRFKDALFCLICLGVIKEEKDYSQSFLYSIKRSADLKEKKHGNKD